MKTKKLKSVIILVVATITMSCSKKDSNDETPPAPTTTNYMTCTLNGAEWKATEVSDGATTKFKVSLTGINNGNKTSINLFYDRAKSLANATLPLQYTLGESEVITVRKLDVNGLPIFSQDGPIYSGSITFTKVNKFEIEGTFNATASSPTNTNTITNGKFYMKFNEDKIW